MPSHLNRILTAYLSPHLRFEEAAETLNLTLLDFIAQLQHPDVERAITTIAEAKARRAEHLALNAHDSAIAALVRLVESDKATGPVRAAAASLLRRIRETSSARPPRAVPPVAAGPPGAPGGTAEHVPKERRRRVEQTTTRATEEPSPVPPRHGIDAVKVEGCPGQRSEAKSAGNPRPPDAVGAVAELRSATNKPPHPITAHHSGPPP